MKRLVDLIAVILPFEVDIYRAAGIPVVFAGHPMLDEIEAPRRPKEAPAKGAPFMVMLFPGSRRQEFERMFPLLCEAAKLLKRHFREATFKVGLAPLIKDEAVHIPADMRPYCGITRSGIEELGGGSFVLAASGTVTLQCALSGTPMVVCYKTSPVTFCIGKLLVRTPWIAMPNVLSKRTVVPELIQWDATPARIADEASLMLNDPERYRAVSAGLLALRDRLKGSGGMARLAEIALRMASGEDAGTVVSSFHG